MHVHNELQNEETLRRLINRKVLRVFVYMVIISWYVSISCFMVYLILNLELKVGKVSCQSPFTKSILALIYLTMIVGESPNIWVLLHSFFGVT